MDPQSGACNALNSLMWWEPSAHFQRLQVEARRPERGSRSGNGDEGLRASLKGLGDAPSGARLLFPAWGFHL